MFYCFLADGFEETEAITPIDFLKRAKLPVTTVGVGGRLIRGSHGIKIEADTQIEDFTPGEELEGVILPGGMPGTRNLEADPRVREAVLYAAERGKLLCAICAAPSILGHLGLLKGKKATCFPGFEGELEGAEYTGQVATIDGNIVTAKGAGCAVMFGMCIVTAAKGSAEAMQVASAMQFI